MLRWALIFLVISLVSAVFGFTGISAAAATFAKMVFAVTLALFIIFLGVGLTIERQHPEKM